MFHNLKSYNIDLVILFKEHLINSCVPHTGIDLFLVLLVSLLNTVLLLLATYLAPIVVMPPFCFILVGLMRWLGAGLDPVTMVDVLIGNRVQR